MGVLSYSEADPVLKGGGRLSVMPELCWCITEIPAGGKLKCRC